MNRTHLVLLIAVLGLATFYVWGKKNKMETEKKEYEAARFFPEKEEKDIEAISVACTDPVFAYVLRRNGDRWYLDGHLASQEKSPQLVSSLIELSTEKVVEPTPKAEDDKEFGLDKPSYTIALTGNGGKDLGTVLLGHRTPGGNHYYGRWKKGGAISTVPAYTLSPLEEEPKDLRENSPFPIEVAAVDRFAFTVGSAQGELRRPEGADEGFRFVKPEAKDADESKVNDLMYLLKDLKVARFLGDKENTNLGAPVASYRAHMVEGKVDLITEFCQPVAVSPKLRYGRRFLTDPEGAKPLAGTEERFVIEVVSDSKVLQASAAAFEDRRVQKLDVDKVKSLKLTLSTGTFGIKRLHQGGWKFSEPDARIDEADPGQRVDKLLWAIRDLRYSDPKAKVEPSGKGEWQAELRLADGSSYLYRFGGDKSGKPFVGFGDKRFLLEEAHVPALDDAVAGLSAKTGATPTPTGTPG